VAADPSANITIYARKPEVLKGFEALNRRYKGVQGSLDASDHAKLGELARTHDVTINCADADNLEATNAILRGMKKRFGAKVGATPILIHTSGTGTLSDVSVRSWRVG
jgi:hypothetical protein